MEKDTEIQSSFESLLYKSDEYRSPDSSDFEGYATPLASSLSDLSSAEQSHHITINTPEDNGDDLDDEKVVRSGELTPVGEKRAPSPPIITQVMFLQKPKILVMTAVELDDNDDLLCNDDRNRNQFSEVTDINNEIDEIENKEEGEMDTVDNSEMTEIDDTNEEENHSENEDNQVEIVSDQEYQSDLESSQPLVEVTEDDGISVENKPVPTNESPEEFIDTTSIHDEEITNNEEIGIIENVVDDMLNTIEMSGEQNIEQEEQQMKETVEEKIVEHEEGQIMETIDDIVEPEESNANLQKTVSEKSISMIMSTESIPQSEVLPQVSSDVELVDQPSTTTNIVSNDEPEIQTQESLVEEIVNEPILNEEELPEAVNSTIISVNESEHIDSGEKDTQSKCVECKEETSINVNNTSPFVTMNIAELNNFDIEDDDDDENASILIFDREDDENSLSSSTSSESFEFTEAATMERHQNENVVSFQHTFRNSLIERYPSQDDEGDDSRPAENNDELLAVQLISAEVEQLVAAINAFGPMEEQQEDTSRGHIVRKMVERFEKKGDDEKCEDGVSKCCHDQIIQTDNDDEHILVDRKFPEVMDTLQTENEKLRAQLERLTTEDMEDLNNEVSRLRSKLQEAEHTIDEIEVEAEQQYTDMTSEIDELCELVMKKDGELASLKEKIGSQTNIESQLKDDVESQKSIVQRQKEIIEGLRDEMDTVAKKYADMVKQRDKAVDEAAANKMRNMDKDRFLAKEAQMSMEIEDLQRELNKQKLILNQTSMARLADTFERKVLNLENELRERDMLICKQNQIINGQRKSPTSSVGGQPRRYQSRTAALAAAGNLTSAGSSSESFQNGLDEEARESLLTFMLSDRHNQLANIYNIGRILELSPQEERTLERHLTKDRFT